MSCTNAKLSPNLSLHSASRSHSNFSYERTSYNRLILSLSDNHTMDDSRGKWNKKSIRSSPPCNRDQSSEKRPELSSLKAKSLWTPLRVAIHLSSAHTHFSQFFFGRGLENFFDYPSSSSISHDIYLAYAISQYFFGKSNSSRFQIGNKRVDNFRTKKGACKCWVFARVELLKGTTRLALSCN